MVVSECVHRRVIRHQQGKPCQKQETRKAADSGWRSQTGQMSEPISMHLSLTRMAGPTGRYDLVQDIREGDKVFHYKDASIIGVSRATGNTRARNDRLVLRGGDSAEPRGMIL